MRCVVGALLGVALAVTLSLVAGCSAQSGSGFGLDAGDGSISSLGDSGFVRADVTLKGGDGSGGPCTGLACAQTCASTSITGKVYDPAGLNPLYNVYVYVPNAPLSPLPSGPTCTACQAPASGDPITSTTTASDGSFTLTNVPNGANIPIVLQLGKWRRHLTLPTVTSCSTTTPADGFFRLPRKQGESSPDDNIPQIAFTTGCDGAECFFVGRVGIDESEFTGPTGGGRVHIYKSGNDDGQVFPGGAGKADTFWTTGSEWMKYDIVFDACECSPFNRGGAGKSDQGYVNFLSYLNAGGRAFTTHYFYNFFADESQCDGLIGLFGSSFCYGQAALPTVGQWEANTGQPFAPDTPNCPKDPTLGASLGGNGGSCLTIDTGVPKGVAFAEWYQHNNPKLAVGGGEKYGYVGLTDIRQDMGKLSSLLIASGTATPWLYAGQLGAMYDAYYFSINTPVGTHPEAQCGRAIFSDVHLDSAPTPPPGSTSAVFPGYCPANPNSNDHAPNELALEFLFFDLSSCVQNDNMAPPPPPVSK